MTNIIEGNSEPATVEDALLIYVNGKPIGDAWMQKLIENGYVIDAKVGALTDKGLDYAEQHGVAMRRVTVLTLGADIHAIDKKGVKHRVMAGSQVQVVMKHYDRRMKAWYYDVLAGEAFQLLSVYQNKLHTLSEVRWPITLELKGQYIQQAPEVPEN